MPETSLLLPLIWQSALVPFAVAAAGLALLRVPAGHGVAATVALAAGLLASYFAALHASWAVVPRTALDALPWVVATAAAGALWLERLRQPLARRGARFGLALAAAGLLLWPAIGSFGASRAALAALLVALLIALAWGVVARRGGSRFTQPLLLAVVAGGAGLALMLDSSQSIGRLSGALAAALVACALYALWRPGTAFARPAAGLVVLVLGLLLANAHVYAGFPLPYVALLGVALLAEPAVAGLGRRVQGIVPRVAAVVLTLVPVAATVGLAVKAAQDAGGY